FKKPKRYINFGVEAETCFPKIFCRSKQGGPKGSVTQKLAKFDMAGNNRTLKELAAPDVTYQPLGIQYPDTNMPFELKSGLIHLLPKFHGLAGEDPHKHLKEFHIVCSTMRPQGLLPMDRSMVDAASGGALVDKTPDAAKNLIENMAANAQQFGTRVDGQPRVVNEVHTSHADQQRVENRLEELTSLVRQLAIRQQNHGVAKLCGICTSADHHTDECPTLQETSSSDQGQASVNGIFPINRQKYDPFSNTYNPGWRDHPNFKYGNVAQPFQQTSRPPYQQQHQVQQPATTSNQSSLEDLVKQLAQNNIQMTQNNMQFQQRTETTLQNMQTQIGQLASSLSQLQSQGSGQMPSQTIPNPKGNVSVITLRNGKQVMEPTMHENVDQRGEMENTTPEKLEKQEHHKELQKDAEQAESSTKQTEMKIPLPFPNRKTQSKRAAEAELDKEIMETFQKVEVNIPLLEAIKQIPKYAKFLKELCTHKRRLKGNEKVSMGRNVSAIIQPNLPTKCKDPGTFAIPCTIGDKQFKHAMLDLGASINVMPKSVYTSLNIGELKPTGIVIQLANRSTAPCAGVLEDVLVRVNNLIFPADFYVLNMEEDSSTPPPLILGRPFLKTAKTKIDVHLGTLSMEFGDDIIQFNIFDAMKYPIEDHSVFHLDILDMMVDEMHVELLDEFPEIVGYDDNFVCHDCDTCSKKFPDKQNVMCDACAEISTFLSCDVNGISNVENDSIVEKDINHDVNVSDSIDSMGYDDFVLQDCAQISGDVAPNLVESNSVPRLVPSIVQPPNVELKPLPEHLKYAFLEENEKLPVIIAKHLQPVEEEKLLQVLKQ
ncbi:hypothetical protein TSUD_418260, partial [Trifolium subterraneum]